MYILRFLLAATYLSSTKHPFDTIVHLHDNDVPFAIVFAKNKRGTFNDKKHRLAEPIIAKLWENESYHH